MRMTMTMTMTMTAALIGGRLSTMLKQHSTFLFNISPNLLYHESTSRLFSSSMDRFGPSPPPDGGRIYDRGTTQGEYPTPPPHPIPNRPLRRRPEIPPEQQQQRVPPRKDFNQTGGGKVGPDFNRGGHPAFDTTRRQSASNNVSPAGENQGGGNLNFLEKFKLGFDKECQKRPLESPQTLPEPRQQQQQLSPPQDADEIFKKMKETGLIPNAVAMLHGLCQDGLVQEAMKLFGVMREKGTIPEVVIYTAVVEGFCKARKLDDAKRIFRKMQDNGISPNAFSYTILIQGLCQNKSLDDALDLCVEMLEAGHSPNLATFTALVEHFCRDKGLEEAKRIIGTLRQKGFFFEEKAVREHLDKKGPFLPSVWEAILGKKSSYGSF